jgi:ribosomal protein S27AE
MTFKTTAKKVDSIDVVEVECPICGVESLLTPLDKVVDGYQFEDRWECTRCGLVFEIIDNGGKV